MVKESLYLESWRAKWITDGCPDIPSMIKRLEENIEKLKEYYNLGIKLEEEIDDDIGFFITKDKKIAKRFGFTKHRT